MANRLDFRECIRFLVCGCVVVCVDFLAYRLLFAFIPVASAKALAYVCGTVTGFFINKYWTFRSKRRAWREACMYCLLYACTAAANTFANSFVLGRCHSFLFAYLVSTAVSTVLNFIGQKYFIFSRRVEVDDNEK